MSLVRWLTDRIILGPTRHSLTPVGKSRRNLPLPGVGSLEVWVNRVGVAARARPDLYLLKFPGTASRAEDPTDAYAHFWPALSIEVWAVNPPGYGGSDGRASLRHIPSMSELAFAAVDRAADGAPVLIAGESLGCVSALYLSARHPVDALVLRDPPPLGEIILGRHPKGPLHRLARALATQLPEGLNTLDNAANSDAPAVMLLSRQDRVVPFEFQQRVAHVYRGPSRHLVLPDADHGDPPTASELAAFTEMTHWLWGAVNRPRGNP
jgi:hypothetical protein